MYNKIKYALAGAALMVSSVAVAAPATFEPPKGSIIARAKAFLDKPATWDKIPKNVTLCMFAPGGIQGKTFQYVRNNISELTKYSNLAKDIGIDFNVAMISPTSMRIDIASHKLKRKASTEVKFNIYNDERVASEDFKVGQCDGIAMSNLRARQYNSFVGSLDAIGAILSYKQLNEVIGILAKPEMNKYMVSQNFEIVGIIPMGAAYIMVNDRKINTISKAAGKKVAVFDFDKSQAKMVQNIGAQPVSVDFSNVGGKFNNGQVEIMAAPALAFEPLELYRGMTDAQGNARGAIIKFPLLQVTGVLMMHQNRFPDGLGSLIREFVSTQLAPAYQFVLETENEIPVKYWMDVPEADKPGYVAMMRTARIQMTKEGHYDKQMMRLLKNVRCKLEPSNYECALNDE
ncbi:hypothetical protein C8N29_106131 [Agitococcus lubricus]|uniref:TRAP-type C4-dicarboxylate transport system substrate-binding protein n=2 Tax=Agitococcus lubricus TaxID=1077255 RepID=A0A2T5IZV2_9GAMM|nr:hypothetical protein C8N29_106131 [Agitococcus lubricus]